MSPMHAENSPDESVHCAPHGHVNVNRFNFAKDKLPSLLMACCLVSLVVLIILYRYDAQEREYIRSQRARLVHGSADTCREKLLAIARQFSADEIMVLTITGSYATRLESYERLADAFELPRGA